MRSEAAESSSLLGSPSQPAPNIFPISPARRYEPPRVPPPEVISVVLAFSLWVAELLSMGLTQKFRHLMLGSYLTYRHINQNMHFINRHFIDQYRYLSMSCGYKLWFTLPLKPPLLSGISIYLFSSGESKVWEALVTRKRLERIFGLIHYLIVEIVILVLSIIGAWHLIAGH